MLRLAATRVATPLRSTLTASQTAAAQCTGAWARPAVRGGWIALLPLPSTSSALPRLALLPRRCSSSSASPPLPSTRTTAAPSAAPLTPSPPSPSPSHPDSDADGPLVRRLNCAISVMPLETLGSLILLEGTSFWLTRLIFNATGITFPTLFAVAFVLSMPLRRAALPKLAVALPLSWMLARVAPSLTRVHLTRLAQGWKRVTPLWMTRLFRSRSSEPAADVPAADAGPRFVPAAAPAASAVAQRLTALSDRYGLALLISYRMAGFVIINGVYLALQHGVDIQPLLQLLGLSVDVHAKSVVASYAAAVATSALWFPFMVFLAPWPAELFYSIRKRFSSSKPAAATDDAVTTTAAAADAPTASSAPPTGAPADSTGGRASSGEGKPSADSSTKASSLVLLALFGTAAANTADDDSAAAAATPSAVSVAFRRASAADLPAIVRLLADDALGSTRETAPTGADARVDPVYAAAFDAIDGDPNNELVVGVCDRSGAVVSCMQLTFIPNLTLRASTRALIEGVRVRADMRGRNIGRAMFRYAEQRARQRGCALLQLTTNTQRPEAAKFYAQLGYVASHIGFKKAIV